MDITIVNMDIESIVNKIDRNQLKLEAEFQRGEVWDSKKRKKLIDTILRGWPIPPVIFLRTDGQELEILDGLQRITTIYNFMKKQLRAPKIDGSIEPNNSLIQSLDDYTFNQLANSNMSEHRTIVNRIYSTAISVYIIDSNNPEEIAELFNRFNSPLSLNTVEKRNAYFGATRTQIKELALSFINEGADSNSIGFTNHRGAYEDILVKICYTLEYAMVDTKISSEILLDCYRYQIVFEEELVNNLKGIFKVFFRVNKMKKRKYSRATIYTIFIHLLTNKVSEVRLAKLLDFVATSSSQEQNLLKEIYDEFSLYASTDVKSIKVRMYMLWLLSDETKDFNTIIAEESRRGREDLYNTGIKYDYIKHELKI